MIEIQNLNKTYDRRRANANQVLKDVSFTLPDTGFVCILGPSGCGKTSLLNAIGGLDDFDSGTVSTGTAKLDRGSRALFEAERNRNFGYIFQNYYLLTEHSVGYNVYLGLHSLDLSHKEKLRRVRDALEAVEMGRYIRRNVSDLSGGQQQRVAIARALARKPRVIFADEPTGNLDEANTLNICTILRNISKTSLVVMVTHEERIARFFADRIIKLDQGRIVNDTKSWQRGSLDEGNSRTFYTGDYRETRVNADGVSLRIYQEEGCAPAEISILVLNDRIVMKLDDTRAVTCGSSQDQPVLAEGRRPVITLEDIENTSTQKLTPEAETVSGRAGQGIRLGDMFREAIHLRHSGGIRNLGTKLFLLVLTFLTAISAADFITLSTIDPEDFISSHSQVLEVSLERGADVSSSVLGIQELAEEFKSYLDDSGLEYTYTPNIASTASVSGSPFVQTSQLAVSLTDFSYAPTSYLNEDTLILGQMPEDAQEVVVDRWVLEAAIEKDGVAQNGISGIDYFLGKQMDFSNQSFTVTIVGICDSGEPAIYLSNDAFATLGTSGTAVASLSTLQSRFPGAYDGVVLGEGECIVLPANAGPKYRDKINANFTLQSKVKFSIVESIEETDFWAKIVVADEEMEKILLSLSSQKFWIYCEDKTAMTDYLNSIPEKMGGTVSVTVQDTYDETMSQYRAASQLQADARTIVTATILVLSVVMLYLLRRSLVHQRIGMLSVYRLLGVPRAKINGIFAMESLLDTLVTSLPAALTIWGIITLLKQFPSVDTGLIFPAYAAILVYLGVVVFHLLVTLMPLLRLLRLPPAQLAAKFDF